MLYFSDLVLESTNSILFPQNYLCDDSYIEMGNTYRLLRYDLFVEESKYLMSLCQICVDRIQIILECNFLERNHYHHIVFVCLSLSNYRLFNNLQNYNYAMHFLLLIQLYSYKIIKSIRVGKNCIF